MSKDKRFTTVIASEDVTPEILAVVEGIVDGWYPTGRIDYQDLLDRVERTTLDNGTWLDLGGDMLSPAIKRIKAHVRKYRALAS